MDKKPNEIHENLIPMKINNLSVQYVLTHLQHRLTAQVIAVVKCF